MGSAVLRHHAAGQTVSPVSLDLEPGWFRAPCVFCDGEGFVATGGQRLTCDWCDGAAEMMCCAQGIPVKPYVGEDVSAMPQLG